MIVLKSTLNAVKKELKSAKEEIAFLNQFRLQAESKFHAIEESIGKSLTGQVGKGRTMKYIKTVLREEE